MDEGFNFGPVLIPLAAFLIGWAIGFFDSNLRTAKKIKQAETSAEVAIQDAKDKIAEAKSQLTTVPATPMVVDDPGILRLKNENGTLALQVDGTYIDSSSPIQRKRLVEILNLIRPWLDGKPAPAPSPQSTPVPTVESRLDAVSTPRPNNPPAPAPLTSTPKDAAPVKTNKKDDKAPAAPTSMVGQINEILQLRIAGTNLAAQGVTMLESPSGGVNVYVGINKYEGVDGVPNEEVKAAIRAAIAEWEKKYTPGLS